MTTPNILDEKLRELALFEPTTMPVLSVYLNAQADQHGRDEFEPFLRKELKTRENTFPVGSAERRSIEADSMKILSWLRTELRPSSNGVAIFACSGANDFFEAIQFEAPIQTNRVYVYHQPHLYTLAKLRDQYPPYAAVIADTNTAYIYVFGLGRMLSAESILNEKVRSKSQVHGWMLRRYQLNVDNYHLRHAKEIVDQLERIVREEGIENVILAGDEVILSVLREQLTHFLKEKVVDVLKLDITTAERDVLKATSDAMRKHDTRTDIERVGEMIDDYRSGGLAVIGVHDVLAALANGQVDTVFIGTGLEQMFPREEDLHEAIAPALKYLPDATGVRISDAIVTRAEQTGAKLVFIEDPALLKNVGGVGASLRYQL